MLGESRYFHRIPLIILLLDLVLVTSLIAAPLTLESGTVKGLYGGANRIDYWDRWNDMDPFHMSVYLFGDFNCHQRESRTLIMNDNQMPVCARDTAIFLGILVGSALMFRAVADDSPLETFKSLFPRRIRKRMAGKYGVVAIVLVIGLLMLPTALDGGIQMISKFSFWPLGSEYESTNPTRIVTGLPTGIAAALILNILLMSLFSRRDDGSEPLISFPGGK
jgi:uncharacterized membrane protein